MSALDAAPRTTEHGVAQPADAVAQLTARLGVETDPDDLHADLAAGVPIVLVDARSPEAHRGGHLPGAINLPHRRIDETTTRGLPRDQLVVVYCSSAACNASTKGALRLAALGFPVKELLGGLEEWQRAGYPVVLPVA